jgi:hypothetical protein
LVDEGGPEGTVERKSEAMAATSDHLGLEALWKEKGIRLEGARAASGGGRAGRVRETQPAMGLSAMVYARVPCRLSGPCFIFLVRVF